MNLEMNLHSLRAIVYHLREGEPCAGIGEEALANFLGALLLEHERLLRAVEFYADDSNWEQPSQWFDTQYYSDTSLVDVDRGSKAKEALKGTGG